MIFRFSSSVGFFHHIFTVSENIKSNKYQTNTVFEKKSRQPNIISTYYIFSFFLITQSFQSILFKLLCMKCGESFLFFYFPVFNFPLFASLPLVSQSAKSIQRACKEKWDSHNSSIITYCHIVLIAQQLSPASWAAQCVSFSSPTGRSSHCTMSWGPLCSLAPQSLSHQSEPTVLQMG